MKAAYFMKIAAFLAVVSCVKPVQEPQADDTRSHQEQLFDDGNYAMFIHFGLDSKFEGEW